MSKNFLYIAVTTAFLTACGGGGSGSTNNNQSANTATAQQGVFTNHPIVGIPYSTATQSGTTGADGSFNFLPGETVTFTLGNLQFPVEAPDDGRVTPAAIAQSLFPDAQSRSSRENAIVNLTTLLQSIDADGDLTNGITVKPTARIDGLGGTIAASKFGQKPSDFADELQRGNQGNTSIRDDGREPVVRNPLEAQANFYRNELAGSWVFQSDNQIIKLTFDAGCVTGLQGDVQGCADFTFNDGTKVFEIGNLTATSYFPSKEGDEKIYLDVGGVAMFQEPGDGEYYVGTYPSGFPDNERLLRSNGKTSSTNTTRTAENLLRNLRFENGQLVVFVRDNNTVEETRLSRVQSRKNQIIGTWLEDSLSGQNAIRANGEIFWGRDVGVLTYTFLPNGLAFYEVSDLTPGQTSADEQNGAALLRYSVSGGGLTFDEILADSVSKNSTAPAIPKGTSLQLGTPQQNDFYRDVTFSENATDDSFDGNERIFRFLTVTERNGDFAGKGRFISSAPSSGGGSSSTTTPTPIPAVSGQGVKGPIKGGSVSIESIGGGTLFGSSCGTTSNDGTFVCSINSSTTGPFRISVFGGTFCTTEETVDECSGFLANIPSSLSTIVTSDSSGNINFAPVTPFTTAAVRRAGDNAANFVNEYNVIANTYGIDSNPTVSPLTKPSGSRGNTLLREIAVKVANGTLSLDDAITNLANGDEPDTAGQAFNAGPEDGTQESNSAGDFTADSGTGTTGSSSGSGSAG